MKNSRLKNVLRRFICILAVLIVVFGSLTACSISITTGEDPGTQEIREPADNPEIGIIDDSYTEYFFRSEKLLNEHYEKHGKDMGFSSPEEYEKAASDVINNPCALSNEEKEDGDGVYYVEATNEFAVLSTDGYIRTYFLPDAGKAYFDKQ